MLLTMLYRWGPAIAATVVVSKFYGESIRNYGISSLDEINGIWFFRGLGWVVLCMLASLVIVWLGGNLLHLPGMGELDLDTHHIIARLSPDGGTQVEIPGWFEGLSGGAILILMLLFQFLLGTTIYIAYTYGEEFGWRGFLIQETKALGFWKGNALLGLISGIWYVPFVVQGGFYAGSLGWGIPMIVAFYISMAYPLSYFARKSGNLLTAAAMQGVWTAFAGTLPIFLNESSPFVASMLGITGITLCWISTGFIAIMDKDFLRKYQQESYLIGGPNA